MLRYSLAIFFFLLYAGDDLGLSISLGPGMSSKNLILYSIFAAIVINAAVAKNRDLDLLSVITPFALLIVYGLITWSAHAFILENPDYSVRASFVKLKSSLGDEFLTFVVFFYCATNMRDAQWLLRAVIYVAIVGNIVTLIDAFDMPDLGIVEARPKDGRFLGFIGSANGYGSFLTLFLPASIALFMSKERGDRKLAALGVVTTAFALVLTFSRGAWVGAIMGSVFAAFALRRHIQTEAYLRYGMITVGFATLLVTVSIILGYADQFMERIGRFEGSAHLATSGRSTIWTNALKAMLENPYSFITGYGYNAYESSVKFYAATHNHYLNYLYNLGIIGLTLFVTLYLRMVAYARSAVDSASDENRPYFIGAVFGVLSLMVSQLFSEYHAAGVLIMAYLGATLRVAVESKKEAREFGLAAPEPAAEPEIASMRLGRESPNT